MMLPKVLIGGFPNSGTSFLCNLVAEMGFSPGSHKNLKPADEHNRWGYWEHLPLRKLVWSAAYSHRPRPELLSFWNLLQKNLSDHPNKTKILKLAQRDNVEVYKDCLLPLLYSLFDRKAKFLIIERNHHEIYCSGRYQQTYKGRLTPEDLYHSCKNYNKAVHQMSKQVNCLVVEYRDFKVDFESTVLQIAVHLDMSEVDLRRLHKVFRPRT